MNNETTNKPLRRLRSFVRREGRMTPGQEKAWKNGWDFYGLDLSDGMLDLTQVFGRKAPCILEIGFGMGQSLAQQLVQHPEQDYIGVEVHRPGVGSLLATVLKQETKNLRVFCADAVEVLNQCIPDNSLAGVQIFFPDPWHKRRHNKRRLIQKDFAELLCRKLQPQGFLHCATDWEDYANHMLEVLNNIESLHNRSITGDFVLRPEARPLTKFEQRGQRLGHGVWDLYFCKQT